MATIKSYSNLEQSKKLAKILPIESADMYYWCADHYPKEDWIIEVGTPDDNYECICAWSLSALIDVLPNGIIMNKDSQNGKYHFSSTYIGTHITADNPIDACVELIIRLKELNLLNYECRLDSILHNYELYNALMHNKFKNK